MNFSRKIIASITLLMSVLIICYFCTANLIACDDELPDFSTTSIDTSSSIDEDLVASTITQASSILVRYRKHPRELNDAFKQATIGLSRKMAKHTINSFLSCWLEGLESTCNTLPKQVFTEESLFAKSFKIDLYRYLLIHQDGKRPNKLRDIPQNTRTPGLGYTDVMLLDIRDNFISYPTIIDKHLYDRYISIALNLLNWTGIAILNSSNWSSDNSRILLIAYTKIRTCILDILDQQTKQAATQSWGRIKILELSTTMIALNQLGELYDYLRSNFNHEQLTSVAERLLQELGEALKYSQQSNLEARYNTAQRLNHRLYHSNVLEKQYENLKRLLTSSSLPPSSEHTASTRASEDEWQFERRSPPQQPDNNGKCCTIL